MNVDPNEPSNPTRKENEGNIIERKTARRVMLKRMKSFGVTNRRRGGVYSDFWEGVKDSIVYDSRIVFTGRRTSANFVLKRLLEWSVHKNR